MFFCTAFASAQQLPVRWEFPNFPNRVDVKVENVTGDEVEDVVTLSVADIQKVAPGFPGTLDIAATNDDRPTLLETQFEPSQGTSNGNEFSFDISLSAHEVKLVSIYYSTTLGDEIPFQRRVFASHNYGYNHATAALESELIGYRTYGGFFFDVQAHAGGKSGLFNSWLGYSSISHPPVEGEDVIHLGATLGLGGLFLRADGHIYRPPVNTPDYTHLPRKPEEPEYRIISDGPLRAIVEVSLPHWTIGDDAVSVRAQYELDAASSVIHCRWWITPLHLSRDYEVGAGIRDLSDQDVPQAKGIVVTSGVQEATVGRVALGLSYSTEQARRADSLETPDGGNQVVVFVQKLRPRQVASGQYSVAAAWQGSGFSDPAMHLLEVLRDDAAKPRVEIVLQRKNPDTKRLESEPR